MRVVENPGRFAVLQQETMTSETVAPHIDRGAYLQDHD